MQYKKQSQTRNKMTKDNDIYRIEQLEKHSAECQQQILEKLDSIQKTQIETQKIQIEQNMKIKQIQKDFEDLETDVNTKINGQNKHIVDTLESQRNILIALSGFFIVAVLGEIIKYIIPPP